MSLHTDFAELNVVAGVAETPILGQHVGLIGGNKFRESTVLVVIYTIVFDLSGGGLQAERGGSLSLNRRTARKTSKFVCAISLAFPETFVPVSRKPGPID
jgi:hypothetical protein